MALYAHPRMSKTSAIAAGALVLVALIGPIVADWLRLALVPAAILVIPAIEGLRRRQQGRLGPVARSGALLLEIGAAALVVLALAGVVVEARVGVEPEPISVAVTVSSIAFLAGAVLFGTATAHARVRPRLAAVAFAAALPIGLAFDTAANLVPGLFLVGAGYYVGMAVFALSLIRLGTAGEKAPSQAHDRDGAHVGEALGFSPSR